MKRLWVHEVLRVFNDRLVDDSDHAWLISTIRSTLKSKLDTDMNEIFKRLLTETNNEISEYELRNLIYCDFSNAKADSRCYNEVLDPDELKMTVERYLAEYNSMSKKPMNLVLFQFAIEHLSRVCRILKQPRSHALLVGVGGSGRQSLCRLAAHICDYEIFQVEITRQYGVNEWREDIKAILKKSCATEQHGVFLFTDNQVRFYGVEKQGNYMHRIPRRFCERKRSKNLNCKLYIILAYYRDKIPKICRSFNLIKNFRNTQFYYSG